jgi:xanthine dehydrogenase molybdopterin-binding subunit B
MTQEQNSAIDILAGSDAVSSLFIQRSQFTQGTFQFAGDKTAWITSHVANVPIPQQTEIKEIILYCATAIPAEVNQFMVDSILTLY